MSLEKAEGLVVRTTDWSESSRIVTFWTRELGKVRALAKGGRRLKSNFESALDLVTFCSIVLLRKSSGSLDLVTEAQVQERFPQLRIDLAALYGAYYVAELLGDFTEDYDPHPPILEEALAVLRSLGQPGVPAGPRLARFELVLLTELGFGPALEICAGCQGAVVGGRLVFSPAKGGVVCPACQMRQRDDRPLSEEAWQALRALAASGEQWREVQGARVRAEVRQMLNQYVTYLLGRRPRLLPYLGS